MIRVLILLLSVWSISDSQNEFRYARAYRNVVDFKNDKPLYKTKFSYKLNSYRSYEVYKIKSDSLRIPLKERKYGIWIISDGDFLYFNSGRHGFKPGYVKLKNGANYYYFYSEPKLSVYQQKRIKNAGFQYGIVGSIVSSSKVINENIRFQHNVLDLKKGTTDVLSFQYIKSLLKDFPDLLSEFKKIENNNDIEVLKMYLYKFNEKKKTEN